MFSNIFQKAALLGASTVASVALTGTMMASSAQAATMSYTSNFSVISNSLDSEVAAGEFSFDKTELDSGLFSYQLTGFNSSFGAFGISESLSLSDVKANPNPFLAFNQAFVPEKYQAILPSALANEESNYLGDGDFPPPDFTREFSGEELSGIKNGLTPLVSNLIESSDFNTQLLLAFAFGENIDVQATGLLDTVFGQGAEVSLTTISTPVSQSSSNLASVPEPTSILGIGIIGVGLTATRRKRASKKIKQKSAA